ncbi:MAG: hypothetical protein GY702_07740, partial [Desulfobulbaceae bacterium]|nr:hypothetical protein [Desulfobulbaceae bacterium]
MQKTIVPIGLFTSMLLAVSTGLTAEVIDSTTTSRLSTDEVENQIEIDKQANPLYESKLFAPVKEWKNGIAERTGFNWSLDYSALLMGVSGSPGEDNASGGMVR